MKLPLLLASALAIAATPSLAAPTQLPAWLDSNQNNHVFYKRGPYNFAITRIPDLNRDMNGVAVGHALAYEALVTGREGELETKVFAQIDAVLKNPPRLMPTETALSPTFNLKYGVLEQVFDWTHVSHAQTIENFVAPWADNARKATETRALWDYYEKQGAPFLVTGLPMNMAWLDSQPYSGAFRRKYPKVNALFWGYHWLQTSIYDGLMDKTLAQQKQMYDLLGKRYREIELTNTKRPFMPMMAETSPLFSAQFPDIANAFDNLHMLHDMVNDILSTDSMTQAQKQAAIKLAIYQMSPEAHKDCKPGENRGVIDGISHDHRFMNGMAGMGTMKGNETQTETMWMPDLGWMDMSVCHHCSMPLDDNGIGDQAWRASTVSADGWTMRVRCALCARDMSSETKGAAILSLATENPNKRVIVFSDERGNLTTEDKDAVFLGNRSSHVKCMQWSQAFTTRGAFDLYVLEHPKYKDAKPLTFDEWANVAVGDTPETYFAEEGPSANPYAADLKARGIAAGEDG